MPKERLMVPLSVFIDIAHVDHIGHGLGHTYHIDQIDHIDNIDHDLNHLR